MSDVDHGPLPANRCPRCGGVKQTNNPACQRCIKSGRPAAVARPAPPTARELVDSLAGDACPACGAAKKPRQSFCFRCYARLPGAMKKALYRRFGHGYEQAHAEASAYLAERAQRPRPPVAAKPPLGRPDSNADGGQTSLFGDARPRVGIKQ